MNTKYTYEIRPNKPFNFMDKTIKSNCSLQLNIAEAKTILESGKARLYRIFPDINNSIKIDKGNIEDLHRKYYNSKPILNRAGTIKEEVISNRKGAVVNETDQMVTTVNEKKVEKEVLAEEEKVEDSTPIVEDEKAEDATVFMSESEVKEVLEQNEETTEETIEEEIVEEDVIEDTTSEETETTEDEVTEEAVEEDPKDEVKEEKAEENKNRFYNTRIMSNGSGKKKQHKK